MALTLEGLPVCYLFAAPALDSIKWECTGSFLLKLSFQVLENPIQTGTLEPVEKGNEASLPSIRCYFPDLKPLLEPMFAP